MFQSHRISIMIIYLTLSKFEIFPGIYIDGRFVLALMMWLFFHFESFTVTSGKSMKNWLYASVNHAKYLIFD